MPIEADAAAGRGRSARPRTVAVVAASVVGAVLLAMASCGADGPDAPVAGTPTIDDTANPTEPPTTAPAPAPTTDPADSAATTDPAPTGTSGATSTAPATTATTTVESAVDPAADPPRTVESILIAGDSMARSLFPPMQAALETADTEVRLRWVIGTVVGDEMSKWREIFTEQRPEVVVAHFMPWESATLQQGGVIDVSAAGWVDEYVTDWVRPWIELATASGGTIVWVGPPLAADPERSAEHQLVGDVWRATIEQWNDALRPDDPRRVVVVDSVAFSAGPDGSFAAVDATVDPPERLMNVDGVHWCPAGAARLSDQLISELQSLGIATARDDTPDWQTSPWANDPESVRASEPNFGDGFAYPPGDCPTPTVP